MADRSVAVFGIGDCQGHNLTPLFGGDSWGLARLGRVRQPVAHLRFSEPGGGTLAPTLFPIADTVFAGVQMSGNVACGVSVIGHEKDFGGHDQSVGVGVSIYDGFQSTPLSIGDLNGHRFRSRHGRYPSSGERDSFILAHSARLARTTAALRQAMY